jgi:prepilin-type processing-associated H-X9-DG protein
MAFTSFCLFGCMSISADGAWPSVKLVAAGMWLAVLVAMLLIRRLRKPSLFVGYIAVTGLVALLVPALASARESGRRSSCSCNLKVIGLALQTYADIYKSFPPAYVTDAKGNRMHSWRVLILPYLAQEELYEQYDFDEPWNGPHNRLLATMMPKIYRCPSDDLSRPDETSYAAVDGPGTVWSGNKGSRFDQVTDGTSNTIAVVEAAGGGIHWMEPRDVPFSSLRQGTMSSVQPGLSSQHENACAVAFCDGHTSVLRSTTPVKMLQSLVTRAGGEPINGDW